MKLKALFTTLLVQIAPVLAFAQEAAEAGHEAGHHAEHTGIPMSVTLQAINFAIYVAILVYLLRKPIRQFFKSREEIYKQALIRAESARRDAEAKKREIQERLSKLESTAAQSLDAARAEANALKQQIQSQAEELAGRLRGEAKRSVELELERAKTELREEMLSQAVTQSQKILKDKMAEQDQKRLQTEFVDKIQEVR